MTSVKVPALSALTVTSSTPLAGGALGISIGQSTDWTTPSNSASISAADKVTF